MFSLEPNEAAHLLRRAKHEAEVGCFLRYFDEIS